MEDIKAISALGLPRNTDFDVSKNEELILAYEDLIRTFNELEDDFGAGVSKTKGTYAHGTIEIEALSSLFSPNEIQKIYYGNWLRDYSQLIVGATLGLTYEQKQKILKANGNSKVVKDLIDKINNGFTHKTWLELITILAINEFTYKTKKEKLKNDFKILKKDFEENFGVLTSDSLGLYRPEEHIDNPKGLNDESKLANFNKTKTEKQTLYHGTLSKSLEINESTMMKRYILEDIYEKDNVKDNKRPSSFTYFSEQMQLAKSNGKNKDGFRHFGAALHILEDYFAHTNFVEIALIKNGFPNVYPWVQVSDQINNITDFKIKASKIPLVTGLFSLDDSIASIAPKMASTIFSLDIKEYESREPNSRTLSDMLIINILEDKKQQEKNLPLNKRTTYIGFTYNDLLDKYNTYLEFVDFMSKQEKNKLYGWVVKLSKKASYYVGQTFSFFYTLIGNILLNITDDAIKYQQTQTRQNFGTDPSHTQIAKDPEDHPLNPLAGSLAVLAVTDLGTKMKACWNGTVKIDEVIEHAKTKYFKHPSHTDWMDVKIKDWADKKVNKPKLKQAESKTVVEHTHKLVKKRLK